MMSIKVLKIKGYVEQTMQRLGKQSATMAFYLKDTEKKQLEKWFVIEDADQGMYRFTKKS